MGQDSDELVSLPAPPPPRPAARRAAIDAALRRFDGIAEPAAAPPRRRSLGQWASAHRGATAAFVTAALVAVISIPAIQVGVRDRPQQEASEGRSPTSVGPDRITTSDIPAPGLTVANEPPPPNQPPPAQSTIAEHRAPVLADSRAEARAPVAVPPPVTAGMVAAAPPPPPPPPPPAPEPEAQKTADTADSADSIIVTGSRVRRSNLESAVPVTVIEAPRNFLSRLQDAFADDDRRAVIRMIGFPLRVTFGGDTRTYRDRRAVERDYDRIFTPAVRASVLNASTDELLTRDGGRLRGNGRLWFGCGLRTCSSDETIRIREVRP